LFFFYFNNLMNGIFVTRRTLTFFSSLGKNINTISNLTGR
jgi:hypothetical protein